MAPIRKVAIFGASGNFDTPITAALRNAGLEVTIFTRQETNTLHPNGVPVIKTSYALQDLTEQLKGQEGVVCVLGPAGIVHATAITEAAEAAGIKRFIINDFGWGPGFRSFPEFESIGQSRAAGWDRAKQLAESNSTFSWTGISSGNPIDWALRKFPMMGFDIAKKTAMIYDSGTEESTGSTLEGIGQAVLGVFQHPEETKNRFVKARSIQTNQKALLAAFEKATGCKWETTSSTTQALKESGQAKFKAGTGGWVLELVVAQLYDPGEARCVVAPSRAASDAELLGIEEESAEDVVAKALRGP